MPFEIAPQPEVKISDADAIRAGCVLAPKKCTGTLFEYKGRVLYACAAGAWLLGQGARLHAKLLAERSPPFVESNAANRIPLFEEAWERLRASRGYSYGDDALENARVGYQLAIEALSVIPRPTSNELNATFTNQEPKA